MNSGRSTRYLVGAKLRLFNGAKVKNERVKNAFPPAKARKVKPRFGSRKRTAKRNV